MKPDYLCFMCKGNIFIRNKKYRAIISPITQRPYFFCVTCIGNCNFNDMVNKIKEAEEYEKSNQKNLGDY